MAFIEPNGPGVDCGEQVLGQRCPNANCQRYSVVYNGNYFCLREDGTSCGWVMGRRVKRILVAYLKQEAIKAVERGDQVAALRYAGYLAQEEPSEVIFQR